MVLTSALAFANVHDGSIVHLLPFIFAGLTAILTAFYMFRMVWLTFFGHGKWEAQAHHDQHAGTAHGAHGHHGHEPHESPWPITTALVVLAVMAVFSAGLGWPGLPGSHWFEHRVNDGTLVKSLMTTTPAVGTGTHGVFANQVIHDVHAATVPSGAPPVVREYHEAWHHAHLPVLAVSAIAVIGGIGASWWVFMKNRGKDYVGPVAAFRALRTALVNLWFVDAFFVRGVAPFVMKIVRASFGFDKWVIDALVNGFAWMTGLVSRGSGLFDQHAVDGAVRGTGEAVMEGGQLARRMVTGRIQDYVKYTVVGLIVLLLLVAIIGR
jgi:NADH-quinone oxidoreductase subunit L